MSSRQRKRSEGAVDSGPARKRSRLLPSSTGGTSQAEQRDLEEDGSLAFESAGEEVIDLTHEEVIDLTCEEVIDLTCEEVVDLTGGCPEPEVITISDDESAVDREQNQQHPHVSSAAENSADLQARDAEAEPRDVDGAQPAGPASPPAAEDEDSEDTDLPQFFNFTENSAQLLPRDAEEQPRDNPRRYPDSAHVARFWMHYYSERWYLRRQPCFGNTEDNSAMPEMRNDEEEQRNNNDAVPSSAQPAGPASPPAGEDEDSEFLEVHRQEGRNVSPNSHEQVDGTGANDAPVAGPAPAEQGEAEENSESTEDVPTSALPGVVIRCPVCMDFYSEILQNGRQLVATFCGHLFCSRCLPLALGIDYMCPTCRMELTPVLYHTLYL